MRPVILWRSQILWQAWLYIWLQGKLFCRSWILITPVLRKMEEPSWPNWTPFALERRSTSCKTQTCTVYIHLFSLYSHIWIYLWKVNRSLIPILLTRFFSDFTTWWRNLPLFIIPQSLHWTNCFFQFPLTFLIRLYPETVRPERLLHNHLHFIY